MKVNSHNEWDKLREIIVGRAEGRAALRYRTSGPVPQSLRDKAEMLAAEAFPKSLVNEIAEDLEELCSTLRTFGVKVHRPNTEAGTRFFQTPYFAASGDHVYNMRDLHLVVGDTVVESPSQESHRYFEALGLYDVWYEYFKAGFRWVCGPKPRLAGNHMIAYTVGGAGQYDDGQKFIKLSEDEILFEAANTVRMGRDLLYLVSRSGNNLGAKWLQSVLGPDYRVHTTAEIYRSSHIDSTALCLRPGLVMLNAERVSAETCPSVFDKWDKVYFDDIVGIPDKTLEFHEQVRKPIHHKLKELGVESQLDSVASKWIGMNFLSIDPQHVVVDKRQVGIMRTLEQHGITPVPISFRHSYYMGGIHCSTLDTVRDSKLESYCD
jgi:glycine amidinotransferase/scyllo-inosamine-4-phosphate amidinotransferase 1